MVPASPDNFTVFVAMSFAIRIVQAVGNAAVGTAIFTLAATFYPDNPAQILVRFAWRLPVGCSGQICFVTDVVLGCRERWSR